MLNSHPAISNPGEFDFLFDLVSDSGMFPELPAYEHWLRNDRIFRSTGLEIESSASYSELINSFIRQLEHKDKLLTINIHRHFHRIPILFPDARFLHILRDPRDVARSCIGMGWVGHVYFGTDIWVEAERSWDLLKSTLSRNRYLEIKYEYILEDVTRGLTEICDFLGVPYSDRMLDYAEHTTYGLPDKRLCYQWKKKYTQRELQLVEGKISKMLVERGYELSGLPLDEPGWMELVGIRFQNKLYRIKHGTKTYGLILYLGWVLSRKLGIRRWREASQLKIDQIDMQNLK